MAETKRKKLHLLHPSTNRGFECQNQKCIEELVEKRRGANDPDVIQELDEKIRRAQRNKRMWGFKDHEGNSWYYDKYAADRAVRWIEAHCRHRKGEWAGQPFILKPWQSKIVRQIFGWKNARGFRRFNETYWEIPRKNGKSTLAAAIALYLFVGDFEAVSEVYCVAGSQTQASLVFEDAKGMIRMHPGLERECETLKDSIYHGKSDSKFVTLSTKNQHGLNPHGVVCDEVHQWNGREQYEAMTTAAGTRQNPLAIFITTAGDDIHTLCGHLHRQAREVLDGHVYRPDLHVRLYSLKPSEDWTKEENWYKANPGLKYGAPKIEFLRTQFRKSIGSPADINTFKRLYLNIWTDTHTSWIIREKWDRAGRDVDWSKLEGVPCWVGLDLAQVDDLASIALLFPPDNPLFPGQYIAGSVNFCPADTVKQKERKDGICYQDWVGRKLIISTPGEVIDYSYIFDKIIQIRDYFGIKTLGSDSWQSAKIMQDAMKAGIECLEVRQGMQTLGPATKATEIMVRNQNLVHPNHEVLTWAVRNMVLVKDAADNYKPHKAKAKNKIDPAVALINAVALTGVQVEEDIDEFLQNPIMVGMG